MDMAPRVSALASEGSEMDTATALSPVNAAVPAARNEGWKTLSIVIPVYYNAGSLPGLAEEIARFEKELESRQFRLELIFVNDGSADESLTELLKIKQAR